MDEQQLNFKPLEFSKTTHNKLHPPMFDGDFSTGEDYVVGHLVSLQYAKDALLLVAQFTPGPDAKNFSPESLTGEVEFLLVKRKGRYLGTITRQFPECFLGFSIGEKVSVLDGLGHEGFGLGGRQAASFWCKSRSLPELMKTFPSSINISVHVYIKLGWFGGWKEIVVHLPKKELYVAHP